MNHNQRPAPEPDLVNQLADLTHDLSRCCMAKDNETFRRFGLSIAEGQFLFAVAEHGSALPSALADELGIVRSRATPLSQSLIEKGYLMRRDSTEDRRMKSLSLTTQGKRIAREAADFRRRFHARLLESFAESDRSRVLGVLAELHGKMTAIRQEMNQS
jgi:DNA-binding MarR family transcriptional regulator